ncbi:hypothetical protein STREPTOSP366_54110 [Streptomyces variabilis]
MGTEGVRTDRLSILLEQFDKATDMARARLSGLGDEEYLWEPVPACWSIRRRGEAVTPRATRTSRRASTRKWPGRRPPG